MIKILKDSQANATAYLKFVCNSYLVNTDFSGKQTYLGPYIYFFIVFSLIMDQNI